MAATSVQMDTMPDSEPRTRSTSTLSRVFKPDPTEEEYTKVSSFSDSRLSVMLKLQHPSHQEDPPLKYHPLWSFSFMIKLLQVFVTIVCAGLYTRGLLLINSSVTSQMFPNIVFASYMLITPVILLSYVLGQKMPELLIRIFNVLGAILLLVAGVISITEWNVKRQQAMFEAANNNSSSNNNIINEDSGEDCIGGGNIEHPEDIPFLLAVGILSILNSFLYVADVAFSVKRTLSYL